MSQNFTLVTEGDTPKYLRNIPHDEAVVLGSLIQAGEGQVASKTLVQNGHVGITLFSFSAGTSISAHESKGDALVNVLEGTAELVVGDKTHRVSAGESLVMPAGVPHSVAGVDDMKMMLVVVFPY